MQNVSGRNELRVHASAPINGQELVAVLPKVVSWTMVTQAIDFGNANGWLPNEKAPPYRCRYTRRGFVLDDGREDADSKGGGK